MLYKYDDILSLVSVKIAWLGAEILKGLFSVWHAGTPAKNKTIYSA
jgi:hypothetical protein